MTAFFSPRGALEEIEKAGDEVLRWRMANRSLLAPFQGAVREGGGVGSLVRWLHHRLMSFEPPARRWRGR
jgi:hypothetical protein